ncbi:hypothetical protein [Actinomadura sp. WMMA1423]|uniref:hypothetical protein n=1 Tax=Actinomadura sp. WMMA1423 TaxID=2591108 RepID=UPI001146C214|nr:hypothetical protein [Actinomadura sp. WMMA1423]
MICQSCRERHHEKCRGGSWCDCQHHPAPAAPSSPERPAVPSGADSAAAGEAEPQVNWRRQG